MLAHWQQALVAVGFLIRPRRRSYAVLAQLFNPRAAAAGRDPHPARRGQALALEAG